jgi:phosphate transport system permease protein
MTVATEPSNLAQQKQSTPRPGLCLLLLGLVAALIQTLVSAVHILSQASSDQLATSLKLLIGLPFAAALAALLWAGVAAVRAILSEIGDPAFAVVRAARFSLYLAIISTFTSWSVWPASGSSAVHYLWLLTITLVNGLPLLAFLYFSRATASLAHFGIEFGNRMGEVGLKMISRDAAIVVVLMIVSLISVLTLFSVPTIKAFGWHFVVDREWRPNPIDQPVRTADGKIQYDDDGNQITRELPPVFGALPVIWGTTVSSIIALVFAVPLSLGASIFLVRIAAKWLVMPVSFLIEFLAAIPSIAYGLWGLFVMCPFLQGSLSLPHFLAWVIRVPGVALFFHQASADLVNQTINHPSAQQFVYAGTRQPLVYFNGIEQWLNHLFIATPGLHWLASPTGGVTGRDMLAGGLILGIMVVPIITAISRDVLRNVPRAQLEGTVALGATWWESSKEMLKYSRSGLFGAVMLGLARAAGETMAITMVIGNNNQIKTSLFAPAQTMSSLLANEFAEAGGDLQRSALTEVALILLIMSLVFNIVARYLVVGKQARSAASA